MPAPETIADTLRSDILQGRLAPGDELRQEAIAARFGVSRMPVRDALNALASERLVTLRPNRGARVIALTPEEVAELYDLRLLLEADALTRAYPALDAAALAEIRREMIRCEIEAGASDFPAADWRFHKALYRPANRPRQIRMIEELRRLCQMHRAAYDSLRQSSDRWSEDHRRILAHLEAGERTGAVDALTAHISASGDQLAAWMRRNAS